MDFTKILLILSIVFLVKDIDFSDPIRTLSVRVTFYLVHAIVLVAYFYLKQEVAKVKDEDEKVLLVEANKEINSALKRLLFIICLVSFIHFKIGSFVPLVLQSVLNSLGLYQSKYFKRFVLGDKNALKVDEENKTATAPPTSTESVDKKNE